jgi:hypothetical protein
VDLSTASVSCSSVRPTTTTATSAAPAACAAAPITSSAFRGAGAGDDAEQAHSGQRTRVGPGGTQATLPSMMSSPATVTTSVSRGGARISSPSPRPVTASW